jgi:ATP-dependent DNA ligase
MLDTISPQRFVEIDVNSLEDKVTNPDWVIEQKLDGVRAMALVSNGQVEWITGRGGRQPLKSTAVKKDEATAILSGLRGEWAFDGEFIRDTYHIFDMVVASNPLAPDYDVDPSTRRKRLQFIYYRVLKSPSVQLIPQAQSEMDKRALVEACRANNTEGVMLKKTDSVYNCGGFCSGILKAKFTKTVDAVVIERNTGGKENARLGVYDNGVLTYIGNVTMIGKGEANIGDVLEVKYLYATDDNILYQPRVMKRRTDKAATDCLINQLVKTSKQVVGGR